MTAMQDREKAFEAKFAKDEELRFKAEARRNKLLGLWAGQLLGKSDLEAYAKEVVAADFEEAGAHFESSYFLTFAYLPPAEDAARAETWLYEGREKTGIDPNEVLTAFADRTDRLLRLIEAFMPECHWLDDGETLT